MQPELSMSAGRIIVYGGRGALGSTVVKHFKANNFVSMRGKVCQCETRLPLGFPSLGGRGGGVWLLERPLLICLQGNLYCQGVTHLHQDAEKIMLSKMTKWLCHGVVLFIYSCFLQLISAGVFVSHSSIIIYVPLDLRRELPAADQYLSQLKDLLSRLEIANVLPGY